MIIHIKICQKNGVEIQMGCPIYSICDAIQSSKRKCETISTSDVCHLKFIIIQKGDVSVEILF